MKRYAALPENRLLSDFVIPHFKRSHYRNPAIPRQHRDIQASSQLSTTDAVIRCNISAAQHSKRQEGTVTSCYQQPGPWPQAQMSADYSVKTLR